MSTIQPYKSKDYLINITNKTEFENIIYNWPTYYSFNIIAPSKEQKSKSQKSTK